MTDPEGPRHLRPAQVRYLAFEGGGAKGIAFIGALAALDALEVRPRSAGGRVRGLSGASAGSMTAFLYAMGVTPAQLIGIQMADRAFTRFFEPARPNRVRAVHAGGYVAEHPMVRWIGARRGAARVTDEAAQARVDALWNFPFGRGFVKSGVARELREYAQNKIRDYAARNPDLAPLLNTVTADQASFFAYCYALLFDLGLFPGFEVRSFLKEQLVRFFDRTPGGFPAMRSGDLDRISVAQLAGMTGTAVAFAGTNVTTGRSAYFRATPNAVGTADTPTFPVFDAVAISAAYPLAFKPYVVYGRRDVTNGYWLDGGVQNNLPLHAFDAAPDAPLDPGMLGIRLEESAEPVAAFVEDLRDYVSVSVLGLFGTFLGSLLSSAMYPTEGGQIRTPREEAQTIAIRIPGDVLSTLAFAPDRAKATAAILIAFDTVAVYFVPDYDPDRPVGPLLDPQQDALRAARATLRRQLGAG